jgi:hypothetical protein
VPCEVYSMRMPFMSVFFILSDAVIFAIVHFVTMFLQMSGLTFTGVIFVVVG